MKETRALRIRFMVVLDILCIIMALAGSLALRFGNQSHPWDCLSLRCVLLDLSLAVRLPTYAAFGLYNRLWRYAGTRELRAVFGASLISSLIIILTDLELLPALGLPYYPARSVLLLDSMLNLGFLAGSRLFLRLAQESIRDRQGRGEGTAPVRNILVVGADDPAAMVVREMLIRPDLGMVPVGFVDADPMKLTMHIHGVPVLGRPEDIPALAGGRHIDEVVIAMPSAPGSVIRNIKRICQEALLPCRTIPGVHELLDGTVSIKQLRDIRLEDLLRREPVVTDQSGVRAYIEGARILVTGAGGSIGSEICRQLAQHQPAEILLLGHGEYSIFNIERELRRRFPSLRTRPVIADVRDGARLHRIFSEFQPAVVFHAAAHKHVPLMEANAEDAFTNNVLGTHNVLKVAAACGVERFVLISTDKAVRPSSVMGATKRVAERLVQETAVRTGKPYVVVRFGNVLGSRGSAVPIFQEQIAAGGPVTITHPEMRRYFMTIPEAVQLVLQAAILGQGGEIFMLDMGEPVKLSDMVKDLIELAGLTPGEDIEIAYTGVRPGEKLYEELSLDSEHYNPTAHHKIFMYRSEKAVGARLEHLERRITEMAQQAESLGRDGMVAGLRQLVPEFEPAVVTATAGSPVAPGR